MPGPSRTSGMVSLDEPVRKNSAPQAREQIDGKHSFGTLSSVDLSFSSSPSSVFSGGLRTAGTRQNSFLQNGAGFGDVGVEGFDDGGILLLDDAALELEGEGEAPVIESEIFGEKSEAFDGFVLREMNGEALDLGVDERVHPGMGGQFRVGGKLDSLIGGFGRDSGDIRNDEGNNEFLFIANNHGVEDVRTGLEGVFDGLRSDKFACGGLEQILFAVGDEKIVVLIHVADVAGAEPTVFAENFAGGFGIFVVALHDARALDEDLSIFGHADLNVGNRFAGTAHAIIGIVAGNDGRSFRQTVALIDGNSDGPE